MYMETLRDTWHNLLGPLLDILFGPDNQGGRVLEISFLVFGPFTVIVPWTIALIDSHPSIYLHYLIVHEYVSSHAIISLDLSNKKIEAPCRVYVSR